MQNLTGSGGSRWLARVEGDNLMVRDWYRWLEPAEGFEALAVHGLLGLDWFACGRC